MTSTEPRDSLLAVPRITIDGGPQPMFLRFIARTIFYLIITPIAVVLRLLGRDPLHRGLDTAAPTYWTAYANSTAADLNSQR